MLCSCWRKKNDSPEAANEAIELGPLEPRPATSDSGSEYGEPIRLELRQAAQESYRAHLQELGREVESRLGKNDCPKEDIDQFDIRGKLGRGSFGIVVVATYLKDGKEYAIKIQRKKGIERAKRIKEAIQEKILQYAVASVFVVELKFTFKDMANLYMVLEYSAYGDFGRAVLFNDRWKATENNVKLFAAQIVLALEFLHHSDIILRDLKPENCIIFEDGYMKLSDFGLSKRSKSDTYTGCGTLHYMAPELLLSKGHRTAVDWWAFGVMLFEMLHGKLPFSEPRNSDQTRKNIVNVTYEFDAGLDLSSNVRCMMEQLLQASPQMRLGNLVGKADDVKLHPWFSDINFTDVYKKKYKIRLLCDPLVPEEIDHMGIFGEGRTEDPRAFDFADF